MSSRRRILGAESLWFPRQRTEEAVLDVEPHPTKAFVHDDGRQFQDSNLTITPQMAGELHHGYRCAKCLERQEEAFPEFCSAFWCRFPMRQYQRQLLEEQYKGVEVLPGTDYELERAIREEQLYRPRGLVTMSVPKTKRRR